MKSAPRFGVLMSALLVLAGCGTVTNTVVNSTNSTATTNSAIQYSAVATGGDFTPPTGRATNPPPASAGERRLILATSTDGEHFTTSGEVLTDQGNVPDIIVEPDGTIRVYYIGQSIETGKVENTVVAISKDNGATWSFHKLVLKNWPQPRDPSDPDVVQLADGTYRLYYTSSISSSKFGIVYATSPDGITFTYQGQSFESPYGNAVDSTTFYYNGLWHMYVLQEEKPGQLYATSTDGLTFSLAATDNLRLPEDGYVISNPLIENGELRMFGFHLQQKNIRSFTSTDGANWTTGDIAITGAAAADLGSDYIQDSTVGKLSDGSYLMVYVSEIAE